MRLFKDAIALFVLSCLALTGCDVDVKDPGKIPDVDVEVEPGRTPDVDVRGPDVNISTEEKEVTVPDVDIDTKRTTVPVPDVDIDIPQENDTDVDAASDPKNE